MSEVKNIPRLRFPEFKEEWIQNSLGDICSFSKGKGISKSDIIDDGVYECIRYGELYTHYNEVIDKVISKTNFSDNPVFSKINDVIIPASGETALDIATASCVLKKDVLLGGDLNIIRTKVNGVFLSYYLNNKRKKEIARLSQGNSVVHVYPSQLKTLKILIPHTNEFDKIADFLTSVDKRIELLEKKKTLLETYKKGVMKKIFNQEIRFKDDNGNDFPDWEEKSLGDIGEFKTSSVDKKSDDNEQEVFLVNYMNVYRHEKITNENKHDLMVVTAKPNQIDSNNLLKGDILFTPSSETPDDIGHSVVIFEDLDDTLYSYHLLRFRPTIKIDILYSHYFCNNDLVLNQICRFATGSTRFTISKDSFSKILINLPCVDEQSKIARFLDSIDKQLELLESQIEKSKTWKKGLLQKMFV